MTSRKLRVEDLEVESFETSGEAGVRGTVRAHGGESDACTPICSEVGETCDDFCTLSQPYQRQCIPTQTCPNDCAGGPTALFC